MDGLDQGVDRWSKAAFRVFGESFEPAEISGLLALEPTSSGRKGEVLSTSRLKRPLRNSAWILTSPLKQSDPLQAHLHWLLDQLETKPDSVRAISRDYEADLFCGFSSDSGQGGCTIGAGLLTRLGNLGVPLVLDFYPSGPIPDQE